MKVLLVSLIFNPDNVSTAQIWSGIATDLRNAGHDILVITTTPHFNRDVSLEAAQPLHSWIGKLIQRSYYNSIPVYHIWMPSKHIWTPIRLLSWIAFHIISTLLGCILRFKPDIVIAPSPPLTIGLSAWAIALVRRAHYIYNVQELYPDIAVNLGVIRNQYIIRFFRKLERFIYEKAVAVTSITPAMCALIAQRTHPSKVHLIPNFVDLTDVKTVARENAFAKEHHLTDKFVITYAGNMGIPQNLEVLINLAQLIPSITILFVGDGGDANRLKQIATGLSNVRFVPYQPLSRMPEIYACSDLFYVGQDPKACSDGIPSKIYRILGNKKPLLIKTAPSSDLARFSYESQSGILIPDDLSNFVAEFNEFITNRALLQKMAENGLNYVSTVFSRPLISHQYETLCKTVMSK
ncbi:MAG: glycosyltransferase family 4 protein [Kiritimatiellae bacterium]|nr:glycosyltransferase family 4 protein [Kiritimatiellia bacterium]